MYYKHECISPSTGSVVVDIKVVYLSSSSSNPCSPYSGYVNPTGGAIDMNDQTNHGGKYIYMCLYKSYVLRQVIFLKANFWGSNAGSSRAVIDLRLVDVGGSSYSNGFCCSASDSLNAGANGDDIRFFWQTRSCSADCQNSGYCSSSGCVCTSRWSGPDCSSM